MSMRTLETAIATEARSFFNNSKLRVKDILEWNTNEKIVRANIQPGEVVEVLPASKIAVCIAEENDKRPKQK